VSGRKQLLAIVGPTGVGKSLLALRVGRAVDAEIVSADSRQVYRGMDVGTAKPSPQQRAVVPHHMIDVVGPDEAYSLALFLRQARQVIDDILSRSRLPIVVGGSGQYVWGLLDGWDVPEAAPDRRLRRTLEERAVVEGHTALHDELMRRAPAAARHINPRNVRRVIRALEVSYAATGPAPKTSRKSPTPFNTRIIGLTMERASLYRHIDERVDRMIESGWVGEVQSLLHRGYGTGLPSMSSLGYRELAQHLAGERALEDAIVRIKHRTHRFARQQYAWFRLDDGRIRWYRASSDGLDMAERDIRYMVA